MFEEAQKFDPTLKSSRKLVAVKDSHKELLGYKQPIVKEDHQIETILMDLVVQHPQQ